MKQRCLLGSGGDSLGAAFAHGAELFHDAVEETVDGAALKAAAIIGE